MDSQHTTRCRRRHSVEFKQQLVALCRPGISISGIALAHGVNANLLRRWIRQYSGMSSLPVVPASGKLVAVQVDSPANVSTDDTIEINIHKNSTRVSIRWPGNRADECGEWLETLIK